MAAKKKSIYSVHPGIAMVQDWIAALRQKTGRTLEEWLALIRKKGPKDEAALQAWLKREHGFGTNQAAWLAERASGGTGEQDTPEGYLAQATQWVEGMYAGPKAALRPVHDALITLALDLGARVCPCQTIVPFYREHVIAQIKPSTRTRIDFGLSLGDPKLVKAGTRLVDTGGFAKKDRITHRIGITAVGEVDAEVKRWLKVAWERDA